MKDIWSPSSFPQRSLGSVWPDSSLPHQHESTGPQFHQMYALQLQSHSHLSLCVCTFWHKTYFFMAVWGIRKWGIQTITTSNHPLPSSLSTHWTTIPIPRSISTPMATWGDSHYFWEHEKVGKCRELSPFIFLNIYLLRIEGWSTRECVWNREREKEKDNGAWWGVNGVRWQTRVRNRGLENRGWGWGGCRHGDQSLWKQPLFSDSQPDRGVVCLVCEYQRGRCVWGIYTFKGYSPMF